MEKQKKVVISYPSREGREETLEFYPFDNNTERFYTQNWQDEHLDPFRSEGPVAIIISELN